MRVRCLHGFFIFHEDTTGEASDFMQMTGLKLQPWRDGFTFEQTLHAPNYSILGKPLLGLPALKTFAGEPWEVFEANGFVYDFLHGLMVPIVSVTQRMQIVEIGNRLYSNGIILPGSITADGRVKDYSAGFSTSPVRWFYSAVTYA